MNSELSFPTKLKGGKQENYVHLFTLWEDLTVNIQSPDQASAPHGFI